jgi:hypothetical protein
MWTCRVGACAHCTTGSGPTWLFLHPPPPSKYRWHVVVSATNAYHISLNTSKKSSREQTPSSPSDWSGSGGQELGFHHGFERGGDGEEMNDGEGERW